MPTSRSTFSNLTAGSCVTGRRGGRSSAFSPQAGGRHDATRAPRQTAGRRRRGQTTGRNVRPVYSVRGAGGTRGRVEAGLGPAALQDQRVVGAVELAFPGGELFVGLAEIAGGGLAIDVGGGHRLVDEDQHAVAAGGVVG